MKKLLVMTLALVLALSLVACGGNNNGGDTSSVSIASMKKAASEAGYDVSDSYSKSWGNNIVGGFTVVYTFDGVDSSIPVLEFKDKASADASADKEMNAGYNYPVQNGKFLTFATASKGVPTREHEKTFLENLINGRTLEQAPAQ
jgi:ABC-type glycerol-3-phosphate transport system substrate-binding protein